MTNYKKYLELIDFFDIKEDGRIFKKERHIKQNGGIQIYKYCEAKQYEVHNGYLQVHLCVNKKNYSLYSHVLVKLFFDGLPEDLSFEIDHKDGNKNNNTLSNLEYVPHFENCKRAYDLGLKFITDEEKERMRDRMIKNNPMKNKDVVKKMVESRKGFHHSEESKKKIGEKSKGRILEESTIRKMGNPVIALNNNNEVVFRFNSMRDADRNGFCRSRIKIAIENNLKYKNLKWKYDF